jgi:hypothetical protein
MDTLRKAAYNFSEFRMYGVRFQDIAMFVMMMLLV